jgi:hypothetical protein
VIGAGPLSVLALAAVSSIVAVVLVSGAGPWPPTAAALLAAAVPLLLAPLFWPRASSGPRRLLHAAVAQVIACFAVAAALWALYGLAPSPRRLAACGLLGLLVTAALHQLAALVAPQVQRLGGTEASAREWAVWTVLALLWVTASAPLWMGPIADAAVARWPGLPTLIVGASPLTQLAAAAGHDVLRDQWFYSRSSLGSMQVAYAGLPGLLVGYAIAAFALTLVGRLGPRRMAALALLVALAVVSAPGQAAPPGLEAIPAWGGWSRPGRTSELDIRVASERRESASITVRSASSTIRATVDLAPGQVVRLAVPVGAEESITIAAERAGRKGAATDVRFSLSESPLLAWVAKTPPPATVAGFHAVAIAPAQMPAGSAAYSSIDALVIERDVLASMSQVQLAGLLSYLAGCGPTVLVSAAAEDEALLRSAVGCGERKFAVVRTAAEAGERLAGLVAQAVDLAPEASSLAAAFPPDLTEWHRVAAILAVCAAAVVVLGILTSSLAAAVTLSALLAGGTVALMQTRPVEPRLTVWAESDSGERVARYRALHRATITRRGGVDVPVLGELARPQACGRVRPTEWRWDPATGGFVTASFAGRLFAPAALCYAGEFPVARAAVASESEDGRLALTNSGASGWPNGRLMWNGRLVAVPALDAGERIDVDLANGLPASGGAEALAIVRSTADRPSLLWPLDLSRVADAPSGTQAWLLLRAAAGPR